VVLVYYCFLSLVISVRYPTFVCLSYLVKKTDLFTLLFEIVVTTLTLGHLSLPGIRV